MVILVWPPTVLRHVESLFVAPDSLVLLTDSARTTVGNTADPSVGVAKSARGHRIGWLLESDYAKLRIAGNRR
jgi:hypothetical protein